MTTEISSKFFLSPDEDQYIYISRTQTTLLFPSVLPLPLFGRSAFLKDIYIIQYELNITLLILLSTPHPKRFESICIKTQIYIQDAHYSISKKIHQERINFLQDSTNSDPTIFFCFTFVCVNLEILWWLIIQHGHKSRADSRVGSFQLSPHKK